MQKINSRIKILFLIDEFSMSGGTEKQLILIADNLPRCRFQPIIGILKKNKYQNTLKTKTQKIIFNSPKMPLFKNVSLIWKLKNYLERETIDILQTQFIDSEIHGALAVRLCKYRPLFIGTRRNLYHWKKKDPLSFYLMRYFSQWTDRILVNSQRVFEKCQQIEGIPPKKIKLIRNAVKCEEFNHISQQEAKKNIGLDGDFIVIGVLGNWRPIKGLYPFFKAIPPVLEKIPKAYFVLVGQGPQENDLKSLTQNLGIQDRILFIDSSSGKSKGISIPKIIAAFDIAIQPSLSESLSNVWLEYMAAGKPIVATRVGDAELIIEHGKNGLLVQPNCPKELANAILYFFRHKDQAIKMGLAANSKVIDNWSSSKIMKTYYHFYENLLRHKETANVQ